MRIGEVEAGIATAAYKECASGCPPLGAPGFTKNTKIPLIFVDFSLIFAQYALKQGGGADRKNNIGPNHFRKVPRNDDS